MNIEIISLFPEIFGNFLGTSLISKAQQNKLINIKTSQLRDFADPPHFHVDDEPYGGGPGMVMKPEPICKAVADSKTRLSNAKVINFSPSGIPFNQSAAEMLSNEKELILLCGRYEGLDQRALDICVDQEYSMGDYVLMGGELPAMTLIEAVTRLIPGVLGNEDSAQTESFSAASKGLLEAPQYTRPAEFEGVEVPRVLLSGNHAEIAKWREDKSLERTKKVRPDLLIDVE